MPEHPEQAVFWRHGKCFLPCVLRVVARTQRVQYALFEREQRVAAEHVDFHAFTRRTAAFPWHYMSVFGVVPIRWVGSQIYIHLKGVRG